MTSNRTSRLFSILTLAIAILLTPLAVAADGLDPIHVDYQAPTLEPDLEQSVRLCTGNVHRVVQELSDADYRWMTKSHHEIYRVEKRGITLASIEVLSSPRLDSCNNAGVNERETAILLTYYHPNGEETTTEHRFESDDVLFDTAPKVFADSGKAMLRGVDRDGNARSRFVDLHELEQVVIAHGLAEPTAPNEPRIAMNSAPGK